MGVRGGAVVAVLASVGVVVEEEGVVAGAIDAIEIARLPLPLPLPLTSTSTSTSSGVREPESELFTPAKACTPASEAEAELGARRFDCGGEVIVSDDKRPITGSAVDDNGTCRSSSSRRSAVVDSDDIDDGGSDDDDDDGTTRVSVATSSSPRRC